MLASRAACWLCAYPQRLCVFVCTQVVRPKKAALAQAEEQLAEVQAALAEKQAELAEVEGKLAELGVQLDAAKQRKEALQVCGGAGEDRGTTGGRYVCVRV